MKHYFTDNTDLKSEQSQFIFRFHKYDLLFTSDNGVFSKSMIDYGSRVLLDNIKITNEMIMYKVYVIIFKILLFLFIGSSSFQVLYF